MALQKQKASSETRPQPRPFTFAGGFLQYQFSSDPFRPIVQPSAGVSGVTEGLVRQPGHSFGGERTWVHPPTYQTHALKSKSLCPAKISASCFPQASQGKAHLNGSCERQTSYAALRRRVYSSKLTSAMVVITD